MEFETTDEPFPGTRKARDRGCTCELEIDPSIDLLNVFVENDCPMHGSPHPHEEEDADG